MKKIPVIIDCDPGADDALNLLLAFSAQDRLNILGITTVAGNAPLALTQRNARLIVEQAECAYIPVYAGCCAPLVRDLARSGAYFGTSGLASVPIKEPSPSLQKLHAVDFIIEKTLTNKDAVILVATGPLTNIAMALKKCPAIADNIEKIIWMGGSAKEGGNVTPAAEFNAYIDPHAADCVFRSECPLVVIGLDVAHQALTTPAHIETIAAIKGNIAQLAQTLLQGCMTPWQKATGQQAGPLFDPCTIAYLLVLCPAAMDNHG